MSGPVVVIGAGLGGLAAAIRLRARGHEALYVLSPVPNNRSGIDWEVEGPRYLDRIVSHLDRTWMPGLEERIVVRRHLTPRWFEDTLRTVDGAGFGPEPRLLHSAWFRWHNRSHEVDGLYFVGAGTHPGAGVPGVLSSARVLDRLIPAAKPALAAK
jgi:phytoene desaturase